MSGDATRRSFLNPTMIDLFCKAGGAAMGYWRAGFDVVGVDIEPQPRYPFPFIQADALSIDLGGYDVVHASPPCEAYSPSTGLARRRGIVYPDLYEPTRRRLTSQAERHGFRWVLENVPQAPAGSGRFILCGTMFGLGVLRHRSFECSEQELALLPPCAHQGSVLQGDYVTLAGDASSRGGFVPLSRGREAMGIDWMRTAELCEAVPPAYTEWIGRQLLAGPGREATQSPRAGCRHCGHSLSSPTDTGRPAEFCDQRHRQAFWRARRRASVAADGRPPDP